jgi:hypothetical protein
MVALYYGLGWASDTQGGLFPFSQIIQELWNHGLAVGILSS